jgi:predicted transcriptional regulator|tara:strand:+ start:652 stop:909 length:258 start_codon:yes stop_codon:yes gene_type:complete
MKRSILPTTIPVTVRLPQRTLDRADDLVDRLAQASPHGRVTRASVFAAALQAYIDTESAPAAPTRAALAPQDGFQPLIGPGSTRT